MCKYCHDTQRAPISTVAAVYASSRLRHGKSLDEAMDELEMQPNDSEPDAWLYK